MNNLSWLLYLGDILPNVQAFLWVLATISSVINVLISFLLFVEQESAIGVKTRASVGVISVFLMIFAVFIPSKETIYLIAASEMGEEVLKTEQAQKVGDFLDALLDDFSVEP